MVKSLIVLCTLLAHLVLSPAPAAADGAILVSAAMSLRSAFEEIGALFAATTGEPRPAFNFGASGDLALQIRGGAPVDVFAAAAVGDMDGLEAASALLPQTRVDFTANAMVLVVPAAADNVANAFGDLAKPEIARIAVGNPKTSPAGRYAGEIFASTGVAATVGPKLVFAETIRQALDYVARGEVDAGVVYATDAALRLQEVKVAAAAPAESHTSIVYPIAVIEGSRRPETAKAFLAAVRSAAGQSILARYGFKPVPAAR